MEAELRYYYGLNEYEGLVKRMEGLKQLKFKGCFYELTVQYDHPMKENSFYSKEIDGRFRIRCSENIKSKKAISKISWKKRTANTTKGLVNKEEEIEVNFEYEDLEKLTILLENIIGMKRVESYERYRNIFSNEDIEIVVDKYPFGVALEIENKSKDKEPEETILYWVHELNLNAKDAFRLSWDDKYTELCKKQNIQIYKDVRFGFPMPSI